MTGISIDCLDHMVLTVKDIDATCEFYNRVLGMKPVKFDGERVALMFGQQKINLHLAGSEYDPKAKMPMPGSGDVCFIAKTPIVDIISHLKAQNIEIVAGPAIKTGAFGPITSVYFYDLDGNLIELSNYN
tara:strand:- start:159 stop:548 length:390 start_codon:yes stop_codon:yes gene_type:complete